SALCTGCRHGGLCYALFATRFGLQLFYFFSAPAPTASSSLSLHDALPISIRLLDGQPLPALEALRSAPTPLDAVAALAASMLRADRKSTRLNSSHLGISYAVFCLKYKNQQQAAPHIPRRHH